MDTQVFILTLEASGEVTPAEPDAEVIEPGPTPEEVEQ
jgi:hypothetical protein